MVWCVGSFWPGFNDAILRAPLPLALSGAISALWEDESIESQTLDTTQALLL